MAYFSTTAQCVQYIKDKLDVNKTSLGLNAVFYGEEEVPNAFPCASVVAGPLDRRRHATSNQMQLLLRVQIYLLDERLTESYALRQKENLERVGGVRNLLHGDKTLGAAPNQGVIDSLIAREVPGTMMFRQAPPMYGTRLDWEGRSVGTDY